MEEYQRDVETKKMLIFVFFSFVAIKDIIEFQYLNEISGLW